jgi:hypothetical protein
MAKPNFTGFAVRFTVLGCNLKLCRMRTGAAKQKIFANNGILLLLYSIRIQAQINIGRDGLELQNVSAKTL